MDKSTEAKSPKATPDQRQKIIGALVGGLLNGIRQVPTKERLLHMSGLKGPNSTEGKAVWLDMENTGLIRKGNTATAAQNLNDDLALESANGGEQEAYIVDPKILEDKDCPLSSQVAQYKLEEAILAMDNGGCRVKLYPVQTAVRLLFEAMAHAERTLENKTRVKLFDFQKEKLEENAQMSLVHFFELVNRMDTMELLEDRGGGAAPTYNSSKVCMKGPYYGLPNEDALVVAAKKRAKSPGEANMRSQSKKPRHS